MCKLAIKILCYYLRKEDYRIGWTSNIAMAFYDNAIRYKKEHNKKTLSNLDIHSIGNIAANDFIDLLMKK